MASKLQCGTGVVLVVDDEQLIQQTSELILSECGYDVLIAGSGAEAVDIFQERHDDIICVLLDMSLPDMSGIEIYANLKKIDSDVNVIVASGRVQDNVVDDILKMGANIFLPKPFSVAAISEEVYKFVN